MSFGAAATELAERGAHVAPEDDRALAGLDNEHLVPVRVPGAAGVTTCNDLRQALVAAGLLIGAGPALLIVDDSSKVITTVLILVSGPGFGAVSVAAQAWMASTMSADVEGALSLFVTGPQGSPQAGLALRRRPYNAYGPTRPLTLAAIVAAGALSILFVKSARAVDRTAPAASAAAVAPPK
jgi:predicted MFS family arabinose efflux permease